MSTSAHPPHIPVVIVGGGQAGLSVSWYLGNAHIDHVVIERDTPMHAWPIPVGTTSPS